MNYIFDTHAVLWYLNDDAKLSPKVSNIMEISTHKGFISQATLFEMSIKISLGKLEIPCSWEDIFFYFNKANWSILGLRNADFVALSALPFHHGDPFDRLIACQALNQNMTLLSKDTIFDSYGVSQIWD